ncbi:hypothetical protein DFH09DRAFT_1093484 [Mycena vulgaris]|nr:hypothetical protein DFH09DRAFT_1093484 [Mycena vulgaris]
MEGEDRAREHVYRPPPQRELVRCGAPQCCAAAECVRDTSGSGTVLVRTQRGDSRQWTWHVPARRERRRKRRGGRAAGGARKKEGGDGQREGKSEARRRDTMKDEGRGEQGNGEGRGRGRQIR